VRAYQELSDVQHAFSSLTDGIAMRPIHHQIDERVQAHIFVAALELLLHRDVEKRREAAWLDLSATQALRDAALGSRRTNPHRARQ